ncbi:EcsC family protein [Paenibacillus dokdonensis]|uniref:EcsC family protein n=1 Tax=Paenibacillus dokdonensis TaxID=2567944 RepID=A0ABU6GUJ2_9BACL|nr:EcsC family protein [Paenibacillus dokdonensis]MEC0241822.1 EcsC family protein [Paenibacillus dokdonensis]
MAATEETAYLAEELKKIEAWEKDQKQVWFWERLSRLPFMLLDRLTPKLIRDKLGDALGEVGRFLQTGGQYLVQQKSVLKLLQAAWIHSPNSVAKLPEERELNGEKAELTLEEAANLPLEIMDRTAEELTSRRVKFAAAQGATTGVGGVFTLAADIPMVLGLSLKVLQEMALCYGYDPRSEQERVFIVKCLQFASADIVGKKAVLEELAQFEQEDHAQQVFSQIQGWREVVQTYRDSFGWKKLFQLVPVAGILFGSISNKGTIEDVAEAGKMLYRKRRILARLK